MKLLKFYTDCCSQCKQQSKILEALEGIEVVSIDCEDNTNLVHHFNIRTLPTLILVNDNNEELVRFTGITPIETIKSNISQNKL